MLIKKLRGLFKNKKLEELEWTINHMALGMTIIKEEIMTLQCDFRTITREIERITDRKTK